MQRVFRAWGLWQSSVLHTLYVNVLKSCEGSVSAGKDELMSTPTPRSKPLIICVVSCARLFVAYFRCRKALHWQQDVSCGSFSLMLRPVVLSQSASFLPQNTKSLVTPHIPAAIHFDTVGTSLCPTQITWPSLQTGCHCSAAVEAN